MTRSNADVLTTRVTDGIALITLGSAKRIYFDEEMGDALTEALDGFAGDANIRVVVVTGGAPGYFIRHFTIAALIRLAESTRASGREWPENATTMGDSSIRRWRCARACQNQSSPPFQGQPSPVDSSSHFPAICVSLRMVTT